MNQLRFGELGNLLAFQTKKVVQTVLEAAFAAR